jgi:7-keto-8-aminopelargonate synthetase-like enzyme
MDSAVHNSVQMATQLLRANGVDVRTVLHGDIEAIQRMIAEAESETAGSVWYLADGVYSMSGATAPFEHLADLLDLHPSLWVYVDDAHGLSWTGRNGSGLAIDRMGWHDRLVVAAGLAKGFGSAGGIVASPDREIVETVELCGPPLTFGGPLTPPTLGANIASADIHLSDEIDDLQRELAIRMDLVVATTAELGLPLVASDPTPIFFVEIGRTDLMIDIGRTMVADGFYLNPAAWPAVPHRKAGLRFTVTNSLEPAVIGMMLDRLHHHLKVAGVLDRMVIDLRGEDPTIALG